MLPAASDVVVVLPVCRRSGGPWCDEASHAKQTLRRVDRCLFVASPLRVRSALTDGSIER